MLRHSEHPPIMKDPSWTRAAPFKETAHARTPSESIANNYTPSANSLKIRNLAKLQTPVRPPSRTPTQQACILSLHAGRLLFYKKRDVLQISVFFYFSRGVAAVAWVQLGD